MTPKPSFPRRDRRSLKEKRSAATRERLLEAARRLFAQYGYDDVSVTEIAKEAGVTHAMINAYFHSKAGLLYELISETYEQHIARMEAAVDLPGTTAERMRHLITIVAESDLADPKILAIIRSYSWQWPEETEAANKDQLGRALAPIEQVLRDDPGLQGIDDAQMADVLDSIFAIYTMGLRPALYAGASADECVDAILRRIMVLLDGAQLSLAREVSPQAAYPGRNGTAQAS